MLVTRAAVAVTHHTASDMNTLILTQLTLMTSQLGILIFYPARTARGQAGPQNEWCNTVRVSRDCHDNLGIGTLPLDSAL